MMALMGFGATVHVLQLTTQAWQVALVVGSIVALLALQFSYFNRPSTPLRSAQTYGMLLVQACLIYLPLLRFEQYWTGMPGFLAGTALLVLPAIAAWSVFGLVVLSMALPARARASTSPTLSTSGAT